jgi:hypothetical protein
MTDQDKQTTTEKQAKKNTDEETKLSARYQAIKKADNASEQVIEKASKAKELKRAEKQAAKDNEQTARYEAIKKADLVREKALEKNQEMRRLKDKKQQES